LSGLGFGPLPSGGVESSASILISDEIGVLISEVLGTAIETSLVTQSLSLIECSTPFKTNSKDLG
jgi:hypothetical protein